MTWMSRLNRHADLVDRMGHALGVDLGEEMMRGEISPERFRASVLSCSGCRDPDGCEGWLAAQEGTAEHTPDFCRNKALIERLAAKP